MKRFTAPNNGSDEYGKLLAALKAEEAQAVGYETSSEVVKHTEALDRYFGKPYGDEIDGRSRITTREIYETVAWTVPDILDIFAAGGRICDLEPTDPAAEHAPTCALITGQMPPQAQQPQQPGQTPAPPQPQAPACTCGGKALEQRADFLNYTFFNDNKGVLILHDYIFDALMHPRGYADIEWDDEPSYAGWEEYSNLSPAEVQALIDDPTAELDPESLKEGPTDPSEDYPDGIAYELRARKKLRDGYGCVSNVPPEDMFVNGRATDMASARYKGRLLRWRRSVWKQKFKAKAAEIEEYSAGDESTSIDTDERRQARFDDNQASYGEWAAAANKAAEELVGRKEYIWYADPDTTDDAVLLRVYRLGDLILEVEEVDDDPFASAAGHRVPHRLQGLSIPEILGDLQKLKTVLTRALVDGTMQANVPRVAADKNAVNLDDLLNLSHGAVIRVDGAPGDKLLPFQTNDLSASTLKALEWTNQIIEQRAGVTRHAQGMDPDSLNHTAKGIQLIQQAANAIKRLLARLIGVGVEEMMGKLDAVILRNQKNERTVKLGRDWVSVDPRSWSPAARVTVSVGLGTGAKDVQLQFLQMIQQDQVAVVANYGPQNPSVTMKHLYNTVTEKLRVMGYQSPDKFFSEPVNADGSPWMPEPAPNPDQQKVQAQIQEGQARLQMDQQKSQMDAQMEVQRVQMDAQVKQFETQAKAQSDVERASLDAQIAQMKAQAEISLMHEKMQLEMQMKREQMAFEMQMQREQFEFEKQQSQLQTDAKVEAIRATAKAKGGKLNGSAAGAGVTETKFGGEPG